MKLITDRPLFSNGIMQQAGITFESDDATARELLKLSFVRHAGPPKILFEQYYENGQLIRIDHVANTVDIQRIDHE